MTTTGTERTHAMTCLLLAAAVSAALLLPLPAAAAGPAGAPRGAELHKAKGVACADCHGKAKKPSYVEAAQCLTCHGPAEALAASTAQVKPENPHASPHWGAQMQCAVCHLQHAAPVDWCAHCHRFGFQVK